MAYKKYIKRGGKIYGPYIYHSKRVDGKVVSEYRGSRTDRLSYKKISLAVAGVFVLFMMVYFAVQFSGDSLSTGMVTFDLGADGQESIFDEGKLILSLGEEFIHLDSTIILVNNGEEVFNGGLTDVIFFEERDSIVSFNLIIELEEESNQGDTSSEESIDSNKDENGDVIQSPEESESNEETSGTEDQTSSSEDLSESEILEEEETGLVINGIDLNVFGITKASLDSEEGEVMISKIISVFRNLFSDSKLTGFVVSENEEGDLILSGSVSSENDFVYEIEEGKKIVSVSLVPGSVETDSKTLSDKEVSIEVKGNEVIVTTDYSGIYSGRDLEINLPNDLVLEEGDLDISIFYSNEVIISYNLFISGGDVLDDSDGNLDKDNGAVPDSDDIDLDKDVNETLDSDLTNGDEKTGEVFFFSLDLTEEENQALVNAFGENYIEIMESSREEVERNWEIVFIYNLGDYSSEFAYDSSLSKNTRDRFEERDKIGWLKDISKVIS